MDHLKKKLKKDIDVDTLLDLYSSADWYAYTKDPVRLKLSVENSHFVISLWDGETIVALARCISDDATIMFLQDIIVRPTYQRQGIGAQLVKECLERYQHVRQIVLMTDDDAKQLAFYASLGFSNTRDGKLNAFVRFNG